MTNPYVHVRSFSSMDELLEAQEQNEAEANERVTPRQRDIRPGDYVIRAITSPLAERPLIILGKTYTEDAYVEGEKQALAKYDADAVFDEFDIRQSFRSRVKRGYLFGKWHSVIVPDGEYGDVHISTLGAAVSERTFHQMMTMIRREAELGLVPDISVPSSGNPVG